MKIYKETLHERIANMFILIVFYSPLALAAAEIAEYPIRYSERPLTLPSGMHQYQFGIDRWRNDVNSDTDVVFWYQYGLTSNLTIDFIGLKYRFIHFDNFEMAMRSGLGEVSFGYGSEKGFEYRCTAWNYLEGKQRFSHSFFTLFSLYYEKLISENQPEVQRVDYEWRSGIMYGGYYLLTDALMLGISAACEIYDEPKKDKFIETIGMHVGYVFSVLYDIDMQIAESGYLRDWRNEEGALKKEISIRVSLTGRMIFK